MKKYLPDYFNFSELYILKTTRSLFLASYRCPVRNTNLYYERCKNTDPYYEGV